MAPMGIGIGMRMTGGIGTGIPGLLFYAPLKSDLIPVFAAGSPTPTYTRASAAWRLNPSTNFYEEISAGNARFEASGYLTEGERINRAGRSGQSGDALWSASANMTVTSNDAIGPFGTMTADLLLADGSGNQTLIQDLGVIASDTATYSTFLKRKTGSGVVQITRDGGLTWTNVTIDATNFTCVSKTQTLANPDVGINIVNSNESVWVEQHQDEIGTFKSSPIVTPGDGAVTRNKDLLNYADAGVSDASAVTILVTFTPKSTEGSKREILWVGTDGTFTDFVELNSFLGNVDAGIARVTSVALLGTGVPALDTPVTYAVAYSGTTGKLYTAGVIDDSVDITGKIPEILEEIFVGHTATDASHAFGNVKDVRIYDGALTPAEILSLS